MTKIIKNPKNLHPSSDNIKIKMNKKNNNQNQNTFNLNDWKDFEIGNNQNQNDMKLF